jgi:hypothetical protein
MVVSGSRVVRGSRPGGDTEVVQRRDEGLGGGAVVGGGIAGRGCGGVGVCGEGAVVGWRVRDVAGCYGADGGCFEVFRCERGSCAWEVVWWFFHCCFVRLTSQDLI